MSLQQIQLNDASGQQFSTVIGGVKVTFSFRYNNRMERFYFNVDVDDRRVLYGRPLIESVDLFDGYSQVNLGNLFCVDNSGMERMPTLENVASGAVVVYLNAKGLLV